MSDDQITVTRNDAEHRYDILVDGTLAGFTEYTQTPHGRLIFPHTEVFPEFGGRGLGSILVGRAMEDVAARGEEVIPVCPFVVKYLRTHEIPGLKVDFRGDQ